VIDPSRFSGAGHLADKRERTALVIPMTMVPRVRGVFAGAASEYQVRLVRFSAEQRDAYDRAVVAVAIETGRGRAEADRAVLGMAIGFLAGRAARPDAPFWVHRLARAFPRLSQQEIAALPRCGCPDGWVCAVVVAVSDGARAKTILIEFDRDQAVAFNDALGAVQEISQVTRDQAWGHLCGVVARLTVGKSPTDGDEFEAALAEHFPAWPKRRLEMTSPATDEDIERCAFRTE